MNEIEQENAYLKGLLSNSDRLVNQNSCKADDLSGAAAGPQAIYIQDESF